MRKLFVLLTTGFLVLGMAGVAGAAVLNWSGTTVQSLGDYPEGVLLGGGVATINGSSGGIPAHISTLRLAASRGQMKGTFTRIVTDPDTLGNGVYALVYDQVGGLTGTHPGISGGIASTSTGDVGPLPVGGVVKVCILSYECTAFLPLVLNQPTTLNGVVTGSKGVGIGGLITAGGYGGIRISLQAAPWTVKTATVIDEIDPTTPEGGNVLITWYAKGWAHGPASLTTSTAQPEGMLQLVTPNQVTTNLPLGSSAKMGSFVIATIEFIPEPGLLLLLGSGVAGLALLGRMRMKK
jgi:hypothetical protein